MISIKSWEAYFSGSMNNTEKHQIERASLESKGLNDAFDFYAEKGVLPYVKVIAEIDQLILDTSTRKENSILRYLNSKKVWLVAASVITFIFIGGYLFYGNKGNGNDEKKSLSWNIKLTYIENI